MKRVKKSYMTAIWMNWHCNYRLIFDFLSWWFGGLGSDFGGVTGVAAYTIPPLTPRPTLIVELFPTFLIFFLKLLMGLRGWPPHYAGYAIVPVTPRLTLYIVSVQGSKCVGRELYPITCLILRSKFHVRTNGKPFVQAY